MVSKPKIYFGVSKSGDLREEVQQAKPFSNLPAPSGRYDGGGSHVEAKRIVGEE